MLDRFARPLFFTALLAMGGCGGGGGGSSSSAASPDSAGSAGDRSLSRCSIDPEYREGFAAVNGGVLYSDQKFLGYFDLETRQSRTLVEQDENVEYLIPSTTRRYVAYSVEASHPDLRVYDLESGHFRGGSYGVLHAPFSWSPNDRYYVAQADSQYVLKRVDGLPLAELGAERIGRILWAPDSSRVLLVRGASASLVALDGSRIAELSATDSLAFVADSFEFSPNGDYIRYRETDGSIYVHDLEQSTANLVYRSTRHGPRPEWSPSSEYLAWHDTQGEDSPLLVYSVRDNSLLRVSDRSSGEYLEGDKFAWSTRSSQLAFITEHNATAKSKLYLLDLDAGGQPRVISPDFAPYDDIRHIRWSPNGKYLAYSTQVEASADSLIVHDVARNCYAGIGPSINSNQGVSTALSWSPSGRYIFYSVLDGATPSSYVVVSADGETEISLTSIMLAQPSELITESRWHPSADAYYYLKRSDGTTTAINSINVLEIDSLESITVPSNGDHWFARPSYLVEEF